ncbi:hypothetical protein SLA2020_421930 [Shorea laevis]
MYLINKARTTRAQTLNSSHLKGDPIEFELVAAGRGSWKLASLLCWCCRYCFTSCRTIGGEGKLKRVWRGGEWVSWSV